MVTFEQLVTRATRSRRPEVVAQALTTALRSSANTWSIDSDLWLASSRVKSENLAATVTTIATSPRTPPLRSVLTASRVALHLRSDTPELQMARQSWLSSRYNLSPRDRIALAAFDRSGAAMKGLRGVPVETALTVLADLIGWAPRGSREAAVLTFGKDVRRAVATSGGLAATVSEPHFRACQFGGLELVAYSDALIADAASRDALKRFAEDALSGGIRDGCAALLPLLMQGAKGSLPEVAAVLLSALLAVVPPIQSSSVLDRLVKDFVRRAAYLGSGCEHVAQLLHGRLDVACAALQTEPRSVGEDHPLIAIVRKAAESGVPDAAEHVKALAVALEEQNRPADALRLVPETLCHAAGHEVIHRLLRKALELLVASEAGTGGTASHTRQRPVSVVHIVVVHLRRLGHVPADIAATLVDIIAQAGEAFPLNLTVDVLHVLAPESDEARALAVSISRRLSLQPSPQDAAARWVVITKVLRAAGRGHKLTRLTFKYIARDINALGGAATVSEVLDLVGEVRQLHRCAQHLLQDTRANRAMRARVVAARSFGMRCVRRCHTEYLRAAIRGDRKVSSTATTAVTKLMRCTVKDRDAFVSGLAKTIRRGDADAPAAHREDRFVAAVRTVWHIAALAKLQSRVRRGVFAILLERTTADDAEKLRTASTVLSMIKSTRRISESGETLAKLSLLCAWITDANIALDPEVCLVFAATSMGASIAEKHVTEATTLKGKLGAIELFLNGAPGSAVALP